MQPHPHIRLEKRKSGKADEDVLLKEYVTKWLYEEE